MNKKVIIAVLSIFVATGAIIGKSYLSGPFQYAGTVEATRIDLPARVSTVINEIKIKEGDSVTKDQVIATLSCEDMKLQWELATENFERSENLKRTGSISKESYDIAKNKKQEADLRWEWCQIKSPVSGTVLTKYLEPKEWVNPGTKIVTVADLSELWAYFYVPQSIMEKLNVGKEIKAQIPDSKTTYNGNIIKVNDEAEFTPKNVQTQSERTRLIYGVKVLFKNTDGGLKPGMTLESTLGQDLEN